MRRMRLVRPLPEPRRARQHVAPHLHPALVRWYRAHICDPSTFVSIKVNMLAVVALLGAVAYTPTTVPNPTAEPTPFPIMEPTMEPDGAPPSPSPAPTSSTLTLSPTPPPTAPGHSSCDAAERCIECWGWGINLEQVIGPDIPDFPDGVLAIAPGPYFGNCAINATNSIARCWGASKSWFDPQDVNVNPTTVGALSHGGKQVCAIETPGSTPKCWGQNADGEHPPTNIAIKHISTRHSITCVIMLSDNTVQCYGLSQVSETPDPPVSLGSVIAVDTGGNFACAIRSSDNTVVCWGQNAPDPSSLPAATAVAAASYDCHTGCQNYVCVVGVSDSKVYCSFQNTWQSSLGEVNILTAGVEGTFCAVESATNNIRCLDSRQNFAERSPPPGFQLKKITDARAGEGYACAMGSTTLSTTTTTSYTITSNTLTTSTTVTPPPTPPPPPSSSKKVPDYAIGIIVGAVLLAGIGLCVALPRYLNKDEADDVTQSFL